MNDELAASWSVEEQQAANAGATPSGQGAPESAQESSSSPLLSVTEQERDRRIVLTIGERSLLARLQDEARVIADLRNRLRESRRCRNLLIVKARAAGFTVRAIERLAGVSNVRVSQVSSPPSPVRVESRTNVGSNMQDEETKGVTRIGQPDVDPSPQHAPAVCADCEALKAKGIDVRVLIDAYDWTYDINGGIMGLTAGDQGFEDTGIVVRDVKHAQDLLDSRYGRVTRLEVIDNTPGRWGRLLTLHDVAVDLSLFQDDGRTLKIFITKTEAATPIPARVGTDEQGKATGSAPKPSSSISILPTP
jgi:hypothetical protein